VTTAIYPGSFDPLTFGHIDILERSVRLFDHVVIAILTNSQKAPLFTIEERLAMVRDVVNPNSRTSRLKWMYFTACSWNTRAARMRR